MNSTMDSDVSDCRSDFALLDCWALGDREAGGVLYQRHFLAVYRFFKNKVNDQAELIQRTFFACVEGRERFRRECAFRTYLLAMARMQLHSHYREMKRALFVDFSRLAVADLQTSASTRFARKQTNHLLLEALRRIPLEHQIVLELKFWEDLSGAEIAQILGVPEGTVRSRLYRAARRLKAQLLEIGAGGTLPAHVTDALTRWADGMRQRAEGASEAAEFPLDD